MRDVTLSFPYQTQIQLFRNFLSSAHLCPHVSSGKYRTNILNDAIVKKKIIFHSRSPLDLVANFNKAPKFDLSVNLRKSKNTEASMFCNIINAY